MWPSSAASDSATSESIMCARSPCRSQSAHGVALASESDVTRPRPPWVYPIARSKSSTPPSNAVVPRSSIMATSADQLPVVGRKHLGQPEGLEQAGVEEHRDVRDATGRAQRE